MSSSISKLARSAIIGFKNFGKREKTFKKEYVYYLFRQFTHPIETYNDIKYEGKGSLRIANILVAIWFLENVISNGVTGFLFAGEPTSPLMEFATSAGFLLLWCTCCWAACTLFDGEGKFKEIWITTSYALLPMILIQPIIMIVSNIASSDEVALVTVLQTLSLIVTLLLEFIAMMVCQQFTVSKTIGLALVTLAGILCVVFIALIFFSISQQLVDFIVNLWTEIIL